MRSQDRWMAEWRTPAGHFQILEPSAAEVADAAPALAACYNEPHNRSMMAHAGEMSVDDVRAHFAAMHSGDGRPFLLRLDGRLAGDADLRHVGPTTAECAIMIGERDAQGRGLGTRFATMVHAVAFGGLGLERVYVSIIPPNVASRRLFAKLGYEPDDSAAARGYADEKDDLTLSVDRARFERLYAAALAEIHVTRRTESRAGGRGEAGA